MKYQSSDFCAVAVRIRNRQIVPLLQLAEQSSDKELLQQLNTLMKQDGMTFNQKVRSEQIMLCSLCVNSCVVDGTNHNERGMIELLREMAVTDRFLTDPAMLEAMKQFCISFGLRSLFILEIPPGNSAPFPCVRITAVSATSPFRRRQFAGKTASASSRAWIPSRVGEAVEVQCRIVTLAEETV